MTFEGKSETSYIALFVHPKNSKHLRSHSRAIMALDHSGLGPKTNSWKTKSGRHAEFFAFDKFTFQNLASKSGGV